MHDLCLHVANGTRTADGYQATIISHCLLYDHSTRTSLLTDEVPMSTDDISRLCNKQCFRLWQQVCLCGCAVLWRARLQWTMLCQRWRLRGRPTSRRRGTFKSSSRPLLKLQTRSLPSGDHRLQKEKKRKEKDCAFRRRSNEKPSTILGCPGITAFIPGGNACTKLLES